MFRASLYPSSGEKDHALLYMGLFAGTVGCGSLRYCGATLWGVSTVKVAARAVTFTVLTLYNVAPQYRNQPHPTLFNQLENKHCSLIVNNNNNNNNNNKFLLIRLLHISADLLLKWVCLAACTYLAVLKQLKLFASNLIFDSFWDECRADLISVTLHLLTPNN